MARTRRGWGAIRKLPSGNYQASYQGPDERRHVAPTTFEDKDAATVWLKRARQSIEDGTWTPRGVGGKAKRRKTVAEAFEAYLARPRHRDLKPRTEAHYRQLFERFIGPPFGDEPVLSITVDDVNDWYTDRQRWRKRDGSTMRTYRAHAYQLLSSLIGYALPAGAANPCQIDRAGTSDAEREIRPATLDELDIMTRTMPARYAAMIPLTAWCALRFGEVAELRRKDIDLKAGVIRIRRGVTRVNGQTFIGAPKAESIRNVAIPPHLMPIVRDHLRDHVGRAEGSLLFPAASGGNLAPSTLYRHFYKARDAAGRPDLHFHGLRHTGATLAARAGATITEQMARLGHKTQAMALRYQHAAEDRDRAIADALSAMAGGKS